MTKFQAGDRVRVLRGEHAGRPGKIVVWGGTLLVRIDAERGQLAAEGGRGGRGGCVVDLDPENLERE
jgi:hypothetical protein